MCTGNSMLISFRSRWRLPRSYGFLFRIYCNPPSQEISRTYNTKPEFCLSNSIVRSKFSKRTQTIKVEKDQKLDHYDLVQRSNLRKSESNAKLTFKDIPNEHHHYNFSRQSGPVFTGQVKQSTRQHPILDLYFKTKQLENNHRGQPLSQMVSRSLKKDTEKGLGHDLDQLTKGNYHEVNLSPNPSLTIMVQPNKLDYANTSEYLRIHFNISIPMLTLLH